jgi:hypothetical protein
LAAAVVAAASPRLTPPVPRDVVSFIVTVWQSAGIRR